MKFLIAGFGSTGRRHLRNLLALGERDFVLYRTRHSTLPDDEIREFPVETELAAALAHRPDAVLVTNPTALHMDVALPAAEAGCHLFLEKPIAESLDRVPALQAALASGGGQALVGFQFRFHPGLQQIARWVGDGKIGELVSARVHWGEYLPNWHPWEDYRHSYAARRSLGGGVVRTLCHPFDYLRWIAGEVEQVSAFTGQLSGLELDVEDTAEINLRFASGALGNIHLDYVQQPAQHTLELTGRRGTIRWDAADGAARLYEPEHNEWQVMELPQGFERNDLFLEEMRHFIRVACGETAPACGLEDGIRALEISMAALRSGEQGGSVQQG